MPERRARLAARYEQHHRENREAGDRVFVPERLEAFRELVGVARDVLDLGCRTGAVTRAYADGNRVVGVDVDQAALDTIRERLGVETVWADVEDPLPFDAAAFDIVVCGELLEHVREPADLLAECRRVLRPGGLLVGSVPNSYRLKSRLLFAAGRPFEVDPTHLHYYSPDMIRDLLADWDDTAVRFLGGRFIRLHARLLGRDMMFSARRPARVDAD